MVTSSRPGVQSRGGEGRSVADLKSVSTISAGSDRALTQAVSGGDDPRFELILKLAKLVADENHLATIINAANMFVRRCSLESAVRSGKAFFVRVREGVLAVDFDKDNAVAEANRLYWWCRMLGLPALLIRSGQQGRRHVFCWPKDNIQRAQLAKAANDDGGDVRVAIRPPLAPHRWHAEGFTPEILHGLDVVLDFARTGAMPDKPWGNAVIETAIKGGRLGSRSQSIYSVALAAVNAGWSVEQTAELLGASGLAVAADYAARSNDHGTAKTEKWFTDHVWSGAEKQVRDHPAIRLEPDPALGPLSAQVEQLAWIGRSGASERAVYIAMIGKATEVGSLEFNCSQRDLMERSGLCARKTVQRALQRLASPGLIERITLSHDQILSRLPDDPARFRWTSTWRLSTNHVPASTHVGRPDDAVAEYASIRHDVFLNGSGLGKYAHRIWVALDASPGSTARDLSSGLDIGYRTVKKHLESFHQFGLADADDEGRWFGLSRPLDTVAADLGNLGRGALLVANSSRERVNYDTFQSRRKG